MNGLTETARPDQTAADLTGEALRDFQSGKRDARLMVYSDLTDPDEIPVKHFFREWKDMPEIEQAAIELCRGHILDVGAAAGCHSLELEDRGMEVTAIDISDGAVEVMKNRGVKDVVKADFFELGNKKFDTLLLLMNGIGICGTLDRLDEFFIQCKKLLNPGGQVLLDSSDILYMYEDEDGSFNLDLNAGYYGEVEYRFGYKGKKGEPFRWLFMDFNLLSEKAESHGFTCELITEGPHYDYLARIFSKGSKK